MKRFLLVLILLTLVAVLLNVVIAWSIATLFNRHSLNTTVAEHYDGDVMLTVSRRDGIGSTMLDVWWERLGADALGGDKRLERSSDFIPAWSGINDPSSDFTSGQTGIEHRFVAGWGWPFIALSYSARINTQPPELQWAWSLPWNTSTTDGPITEMILPLRPVWPGFIVNWMLYVLLLVWVYLFISQPKSCRQLVFIPLCVVIGLFTTVAVAWGCALWSSLPEHDEKNYVAVDDSSSDVAWLIQRGWGTESSEINIQIINDGLAIAADFQLWKNVQKGIGVRHITYQQQADRPQKRFFPERPLFHQLRYQCGWPLTCFDAAKHQNWIPLGTRTSPNELFTLPIRWRTRARYSNDPIPSRPVWLGLVINTTIYSSLLWIALMGLLLNRKRRLRRRGLCINCKYDLSHAPHNVCPECGDEVKLR